MGACAERGRPSCAEGGSLRKVAALIGPGQRGRWLVVVGMAAAVAVAEAASTAMVFAVLGALVGEQDGMALPLVGDVRDHMPWEGTELLAALGVATAMVFTVRSSLILVQHYVQFRVAEHAAARLSIHLLRGYLTMPYAFHLQRNSAEMVRNAFDSVQRFVDEGLVPGVQALGKTAIVGGVVGVLLITSPLATAFAAAVLAPLTWLVLNLVHPRVKRLGRTAQTTARRNLQSLQQSLHGMRELSVLGREAAFVEAYARDRRELARTRYLRHTAAQVPRVAIETALVVFIVALVWVTAMSEGGVGAALPVLGLFAYSAARLLPELQHITKGLSSVKFVTPAVDDMHADIRAFATGSRAESGRAPLPFSQALIAKDVSYRYPDAEAEALSGVSLTLRPGESIGVVGPNGGGKSTLVDVLLGLLEPTAGQVTVDGVDVHTHTRAWQANLGVVPQMVFLIDDTVRANVALGVPPEDVDEDAITEAVAMAQLDDFVASLPLGLDTVVGERGIRVSGGQRQRLAIARALYHRPRVLVFDEGTSALDNETEAALMRALRCLRGQRTLIAVAHRLTTVQQCDRVLLVRNGRIADRGPFAELRRRNPELARPEAVTRPA